MALAREQWVFILNLKVDQAISHTYMLLNFRRGIPACFPGSSLQLTNDTEAHLLQQRVPYASPESTSQAAPTKGTSVPVPMAMIGPKFIATLGEFVGKFQKSSPVYTRFSCWKLRTFSVDQSIPAHEDRL